MHHFIHQIRIKPSLDSFCSNRGWRHDVAGKFIRGQRRIKIAIIVAIITTIVAAAFAEHAVERTAPVRLSHPSDVESRGIPVIEIEMSVVGIVNDIGIMVEQRTALTT